MRYIISLFFVFFSIVASAQVEKNESKKIIVGAEQFDSYFKTIEGKSIAVVANHSSLIGRIHIVDTLIYRGINIKKIFTPEHGFRGKTDAGQLVKSSVDPVTHIPVVSLYDKKKKPTSDDLKGINIVVFDIQDVGARFYTYISTMTYVMEACAENNIPFIVLDRPNPNGFYVDGPVLNKKYVSFIGMHQVPIVHGMTVGEYAQMINNEGWLKNGEKCNLTVVKVLNYSHKDRYVLPVNPSPNLKTKEAIYLYPSLCLFEGTKMSVGRGTDKPFEIYGYPNMKGASYSFTPKNTDGASKPLFEGKICKGFDLKAYADDEIMKNGGINVEWLIDSYKKLGKDSTFFNNYFDYLAGTTTLRKQIKEGKDAKTIKESWQKELNEFKVIRKKYLLYPDFE